MDNNKALQNLLNGTASEEEIQLLKQALVSGEISIGGNVNQSVIIIGNGNTVKLTPEALDRLNARSLLGDLDRDLTGDEIVSGLNRLESELPLRAPILLVPFQEQARRLRPSLKTNATSLSEQSRKERVEALAVINSLCMEALDISFNALCLGEEPPEYDARSPFRGLESFRPEDSVFFFGREALTKKLVGKIQSHSFLAVLGASGSGKSSLVMAGLIPALDVDYVIFRPGTNPLGELESARGKALIVVDQFEELFTLTRDEAMREKFIAKLLDTRQKIVITLRSDFLGDVGAYRALSEEIQNHLEIIPPMDMSELRRAIEGQAGVIGLRFEADLSHQILDDVEGEPGAMPLLQHSLWELWNRRRGRWLRASEYRAFGGVKQAITSTAEKVYAECTKAEQEQLRDIFLRLTRLDDNDEGRDTRRRVPLGDLIPSGRDAASITLLLDKLANARLIVKTVNKDTTEVEVAHEALIRHWERLRLWLNEDRDNLRLRESVSEDARRWENAGRDESLLNHRGGRLDDALVLGENSRYGLTEIEKVYLNGCIALRNKEQSARERRYRWMVIASVAAATIFLVLGGFGLTKSNEASKQARLALANQLASQAQSLTEKDPGLSLLLATESLRLNLITGHPRLPQIDNAMRDSLSNIGGQILNQSRAPSAFSPDNHWLVTYSNDHIIQIWDLTKNNPFSAPVKQLKGNTPIDKFIFSDNGRWLVVLRGAIELWDLSSENPSGKLLSKDANPIVSRFSSDNRYLVTISALPSKPATSNSTSSKSMTIILWNLETGNPSPQSTISTTVTSQLKKINENMSITPFVEPVISPDYHWLFIANRNIVEVWDLTTANRSNPHYKKIGHGDVITDMVYFPDKHRLITAGWDRKLRVWDLTSTEATIDSSVFYNNDEPMTSVALSPDGHWLVSGDKVGVTRIWNLSDPTNSKPSAILQRADEYIGSIIIDPNSRWIVVFSDSYTGYLWALSDKQPAGMPLRLDGDDCVHYADFSKSSNWLIAGCAPANGHGRVNLYDLRHSVLTTRPIVLILWSEDVSISFDNHWLVTNSFPLRVWDLSFVDTSITPLGGLAAAPILLDNTQTYSPLAFSPNGEWLFAGHWNKRGISLFDLRGGTFNHEPIILGNSTNEIFFQSFVFSSNNRWLVTDGGKSGNAVIWDLSRTTNAPLVLHGHDGSITSVAISTNSHWLATGGEDKTLQLWNISGLKNDLSPTPIVLKGFKDTVTSIAFSPDGSLIAAGSKDSTVQLWNLSSLADNLTTNLWIFTGHHAAVTSVAFNSNSQLLAAGGEDGTVLLWNLPASKRNITPIILQVDTKKIDSVTFSRNNHWLVATGFDPIRTIYLWDIGALNFSTIPIEFQVPSFSEPPLVISSDNQWLVVGDEQGNTRLWNLIDLDTNTKPTILPGHFTGLGLGVSSVAIDNNSRWLATTGEDGSTRLWQLKSEELIETACKTAGRNLTRAEWDQYIGDALPYQAVCPNWPIEAESTPMP